MKKTKVKSDAAGKQPKTAPRTVDAAALDAVQGGAGNLPGQENQHSETFVRRRRRVGGAR